MCCNWLWCCKEPGKNGALCVFMFQVKYATMKHVKRRVGPYWVDACYQCSKCTNLKKWRLISADKTGTLTTNQMSVSRMFIFDKIEGSDISVHEFEITGSTYEPIGEVFQRGQKIKGSEFDALQEIATICIMCNDSAIDFNEFKQAFEKVGEATETALIVLAEKINPYALSKTGLDRRGSAIVCRGDMETKWKKVFAYIYLIRYYFCKHLNVRINWNVFAQLVSRNSPSSSPETGNPCPATASHWSPLVLEMDQRCSARVLQKVYWIVALTSVSEPRRSQWLSQSWTRFSKLPVDMVVVVTPSDAWLLPPLTAQWSPTIWPWTTPPNSTSMKWTWLSLVSSVCWILHVRKSSIPLFAADKLVSVSLSSLVTTR